MPQDDNEARGICFHIHATVLALCNPAEIFISEMLHICAGDLQKNKNVYRSEEIERRAETRLAAFYCLLLNLGKHFFFF